jgi:hypothetical protein
VLAVTDAMIVIYCSRLSILESMVGFKNVCSCDCIVTDGSLLDANWLNQNYNVVFILECLLGMVMLEIRPIMGILNVKREFLSRLVSLYLKRCSK